MKPHDPPRELPPLTAEAARQLQLWEQLREQMQKLHAELEYTRLMLKLESRNGQ